MLSKSLQSDYQRAEVEKRRKSYEFINYYNTSVKSKGSAQEYKNVEEEFETNKENVIKQAKKKDKMKKKLKNDSMGVLNVDVTDVSFNSKETSTPKPANKSKSDLTRKSIMKVKPTVTDLLDSSVVTDASIKTSKRKKRNKSVSFMLDDVKPEAKKSKSNLLEQDISSTENLKKKNKKKKHVKKSEVVNVALGSNSNLAIEEHTGNAEEQVNTDKIKKKKLKSNILSVSNDAAVTDTSEENSHKTKKKKKRQAKSNSATDEEPATKSSRKTEKPDMIAESLESLNLGSNAHTLVELIDQMTVVDKDKSKKRKKAKGKKEEKIENDKKPDKEDNNESGEVKEKIKWVKKKWNKGRRDFTHSDRIQTSVIIENLPLSAMLSYKSILSDHFSSCGQIKQIGVAELYPVENPKPIFNTTILFDSEDAATKALEEDNTLLEGNRIRVKRPLPYNQTTIVVRTFAELTEQTMSTMFSSAGHIRKIKMLVKGKKLCSTAFIEFDSADAVERAIKSVEGVLINRKKINVFKYQDEYGRKEKGVTNENNQ